MAMPGTASFLERHEWIKHGTCHRGAGGADEYYDDTLLLVDAINGSPVAALLAERVGGELETAELRQAFDAAFGAGRRRPGAGAVRRRRRPDAGAGAAGSRRPGSSARTATPAR